MRSSIILRAGLSFGIGFYQKTSEVWYVRINFIRFLFPPGLNGSVEWVSSFQSADPDNTTESYVINRNEIGEVTLKNFTPEYNSDVSNWKVTALKTYFYTSPSLTAKPKKAYLVKGNEVTSLKKFKTFVFCSFTNNKGVTTSGFIQKKDLLWVAAAKY